MGYLPYHSNIRVAIKSVTQILVVWELHEVEVCLISW